MKRRIGRRRAGWSMLLVLAILALVASLGTAAVMAVRDGRQQIDLAQRRMQSEFVMQAAKERAIAHLRSNPEYRGETWNVPAADLGGHPASVDIVVHGPAPQQLAIHVRYPSDAASPVSSSETFQVLP